MKKLLACIDDSSYSVSICDHAAWAARRLDASVELLHVIQRNEAVSARHDLSGAVGLGAKSALLEELVAIDEAEGKLARERGRALLAAAEARLREDGVTEITQAHRHGGIVETVIEREADADLVVMGKRGASANFAKGHLGSKVERVVRESIRPVLVAARAFTPPRKGVIAFDGGPSARKAIEFASHSPLLGDMELHIVMAGTQGGTRQIYLDWAQAQIPTATVKRLDGSAENAICNYIAETSPDILIMGAYGHSPLRTLIVGSTTTAMMRSCQIPVLLFR